MGFEQTPETFIKYRHPSMVYACFSPTLNGAFVYCYSRYFEGVRDKIVYLNSKDAAREVIEWAENAIHALQYTIPCPA